MSDLDVRFLKKVMDFAIAVLALAKSNSNINDRFDTIDAALDVLQQQGIEMAHSVAEIAQNLDDMTALVGQILDLIHAGDAEKAALRQQVADLVAAATMAQADKDALQAEIDAAFTKSEDTENALRAVVPGVPPVGGEPLGVTFADQASFDASVASYTGPERVTLDGADVKAGSDPSLDYFSHSEDGHIDNMGPTT